MRPYRFAAVLGLWMCAGCANPLASLREQRAFATPLGAFQLRFATEDVGSNKVVAKSIEAATPRLSRWGGLREPIDVHVLPTHALLEQAVNRSGYSWLRAWAMYNEIYVQSPRTWSFFGASQSEVDETLLHELTHCVMYQQAGTATTWRRKEIPLWFREGMASFTASQGYRWPTLEDLAQYYGAHPDSDPVGKPESLYQSQNDIVYGAAHHAFSFLMKRYGEERVRQVLTNMSGGQVFPDAFTAAIGVPPRSFVDDFEHYVRWRAFRGGRLRVKPQLRPPGSPAETSVQPTPAPPAPPASTTSATSR